MLLAPVWLLGLLALGVPLALHLWSRRPGRVLRVGTTRHLTDLPPVRRLSLRLTERGLLALRLGVLAAVALALAEPRLALPALRGGAPLVLLDPALRRDSAAWLGDRRLDSLRRGGTELRLLAEGFPPADAPAPDENTPLWDRLAEADRRLPAGRPFVVLARPAPSGLGARRPVLGRQVTWLVPEGAGPRWQVAAAWRSAPGAVELLLADGGAAARRLVRGSVAAAPGVHPLAAAPAVLVAPGADGALTVRLQGADADPALVGVSDVAPLAVAVSGLDSAASRQLHAAAVTLGEVLGRPVRAAPVDGADLVLVSSVEAPGRHRRLVPTAWLALPALPDSLRPGWPAPVPLRPAADARAATLAQAAPAVDATLATAARSASLRVPLLWLGLLLLLVERWLAARGAREGA